MLEAHPLENRVQASLAEPGAEDNGAPQRQVFSFAPLKNPATMQAIG